MQAVRVQNGTNAGWRVVKPTPKDWACSCGPQRHYLKRCPECWEERPDEG